MAKRVDGTPRSIILVYSCDIDRLQKEMHAK